MKITSLSPALNLHAANFTNPFLKNSQVIPFKGNNQQQDTFERQGQKPTSEYIVGKTENGDLIVKTTLIDALRAKIADSVFRIGKEPTANMVNNIDILSKEIKEANDKVSNALVSIGERPTGSIADDANTLAESTHMDDKSGAKNSKSLFADLAEARKNAIANNRPLSLVMFDMDNFKGVNDLLGYDMGDNFISYIGHDLMTTAHKHGLDLHRFGGEEFVFICENMKKDRVIKAADEGRIKLAANDAMKAQVPAFLAKGRIMIRELSKKQEPFRELKTIKANIKFAEEMSSRCKDPSTIFHLTEEQNRLEQDFFKKFASLINDTLKNEKNLSGEEVELLNECMDNLKVTNTLKARELFRRDDVKSLLDDKYDYDAKIAQIKKWVSSLEAAGSFTITCGVKEFSPKELRNIESFVAKKNEKTVQDAEKIGASLPKMASEESEMINRVGEVMKKGKKSGKGKKVYT